MSAARASDPVELDPVRVEARVDQMLHGDVVVPTLVIVDGVHAVELAAVDRHAALAAAQRIATAATALMFALRPGPAAVGNATHRAAPK